MIEPGNVVAILLAAGKSRRFGDGDKLLADLHGQPLVTHAARRIVDLKPGHRIAVCSAGADKVADLLRPLGFEIVFNANPEAELSSSLACGIGAVGSLPEAALIALGDMPFVSLSHLQSLLMRFDAHSFPIIASMGRSPMPPAIFARSYFDRLKGGQGDHGAKALISTAAHVSAPVAELADIDTIDDLSRLTP